MTIQPCAGILPRAVGVFTDSTNTNPIETVPLAECCGVFRTAPIAPLWRPYDISSPRGTRHVTGRKRKEHRLYALLRPTNPRKGGGLV